MYAHMFCSRKTPGGDREQQYASVADESAAPSPEHDALPSRGGARKMPHNTYHLHRESVFLSCSCLDILSSSPPPPVSTTMDGNHTIHIDTGRPYTQSASAPATAEPKSALRPYQAAVVDRAVELYGKGTRRLLVPLATGLGKTVVFTHLPQVQCRPGPIHKKHFFYERQTEISNKVRGLRGE